MIGESEGKYPETGNDGAATATRNSEMSQLNSGRKRRRDKKIAGRHPDGFFFSFVGRSVVLAI